MDYVFVDECQDLSPAQLDLVLKNRIPSGRMLFVGDLNHLEHQKSAQTQCNC